MNYIRIFLFSQKSYLKLLMFLSGIGLVYFSGCYYDNEVDLYPGNCTTQNVTYTQFVRPFVDADVYKRQVLVCPIQNPG